MTVEERVERLERAATAAKWRSRLIFFGGVMLILAYFRTPLPFLSTHLEQIK